MDIIKTLQSGYDKTIELATAGTDTVKQKIKDSMRDKAYKNAIERCKQNQVDYKELSADEMGVIVNEEEKKIKDSMKDMSFKTIIAFLGFEAIFG